MDLNLSRPRIVNHLVKGAIFGIVAYRLGIYALQCSPPWNYLLAVVVWLLAAGLLRNIHALLIRPRLVLSREAIRLRYWHPTVVWSWAVYRPWNAVVDVTIPWSQYVGCRTAKFSGGDPWDAWEGLVVDTLTAEHEIGWDVFAQSVDRLKNEIGDYYEVQFRQPAKEALAVADFLRQRFATPMRLNRKQTPTGCVDTGCAIFLAPLFLILCGAAGSLCMLGVTFGVLFGGKLLGVQAEEFMGSMMKEINLPNGKGPPLCIAIGVCGGILVGIGAGICWTLQDLAKGRRRIVEFRADGLALGKTPERLEIIPWQSVLCANVIILTTKRTSQGTTYTSTSTWVEVHVRDRPPIELSGDYGRSVAELSELIDPPVTKLAAARENMAAGMDIETAAVTAGMPGREPC